MAEFMGTPGVQRFTTTDGVVGTSGKPIRVFDVIAISGGTATSVKLRNGTSATDTIQIQIDGVINKQASYVSNKGVLFPNGCFADVDANTAALTVSFWQEA